MKKNFLFSAALCCLLALPSASFANDASNAYDACMDKAMTTVDMNLCVEAFLKQEDARLNAEYKSFIKDLPADVAQKAKDAQNAWIQYRDATVQLMADQWFGSIGIVNATAWAAEATKERADFFHTMQNQEDGE